MRSDLRVSGGMFGSADAKLGAKALPLEDLIKSSFRRSSHPTAVVEFEGRLGSSKYALYFISDAIGIYQHICLVDLDRERPMQVMAVLADRNHLAELKAACEKSLALIEALDNGKGPRDSRSEQKAKLRYLPKEGWSGYENIPGWHYYKLIEDGTEAIAICGNSSLTGRVPRLCKEPAEKKCADCVALLKKSQKGV